MQIFLKKIEKGKNLGARWLAEAFLGHYRLRKRLDRISLDCRQRVGFLGFLLPFCIARRVGWGYNVENRLARLAVTRE